MDEALQQGLKAGGLFGGLLVITFTVLGWVIRFLINHNAEQQKEMTERMRQANERERLYADRALDVIDRCNEVMGKFVENNHERGR